MEFFLKLKKYKPWSVKNCGVSKAMKKSIELYQK